MSCEEVTSIFLTHYNTRSGAEGLQTEGEKTHRVKSSGKRTAPQFYVRLLTQLTQSPMRHHFTGTHLPVKESEVRKFAFEPLNALITEGESHSDLNTLLADLTCLWTLLQKLPESQNSSLLTTTCRPESSPVLWVISSFKCVSNRRTKAVTQAKML